MWLYQLFPHMVLINIVMKIWGQRVIGITFIKRLYASKKRQGPELVRSVLGNCQLHNFAMDYNEIEYYPCPLKILLYILAYENTHLPPSFSSLWLPFTQPLLFFLSFLSLYWYICST